MKHTKTLFFAFAAALTMMVSCAKEDLSPMRFHATIDNNDAKCTINGGSVIWNSNELVHIYSSSSTLTTGEDWSATSIAGGGLNADFVHTGTSAYETSPMGTVYYAVSDVISSGSLNGSTLSVNINSNVDASSPIAFMAAKSNGTDCFLPFKHFSGLLQFDYSMTNAGNYQLSTIEIRTDKPLCGEFSISFDANGVPTATAQGSTSNTLIYNTNANFGSVYFPIMPGTYETFDIVFTATKKNKPNKVYTMSFDNANGSLVFARGQKRVIGSTISWNPTSI